MPPLVFIHIPKTAGTTLHKILSHQFKPSETAIHHDADGPPPEALIKRMSGPDPAIRLVMGHTSARFHMKLPEVRYLTCLRDPVARLMSHYHHARLDPDHYLHKHLVRCRWGPAEYVSSGLSGELSNGMTRMIAGMENFHGDVPGPEHLERARQLLVTHFEGVILTERFDEGLVMLGDSLGWRSPYYLRRKVGGYSSDSALPDPETRRVIEEHNLLDLELYQWARDYFERRVSVVPDLSSRVRRFRFRNRYMGKAVFLVREVFNRLA